MMPLIESPIGRTLLFWIPALLSARVLTVGSGADFDNLSSVSSIAAPGDTLLFRPGAYEGDQTVENFRGTADGWISILAEAEGEAVIRGGGEAWHFIDAEYVRIRGFTFERQSGNGVNADDGGDYSTPSRHLIFERCTFRDMESEDNSDLLKLSGVDAFEVRECAFLNGSSGGSGIDMVGCHGGVIGGNRFENMGSNAIQAKGGSSFIRIERNFFRDCGDRTLNLGGSTDLQFFRPPDAPAEAADLSVFSNIFVGSEAPVAYVGCVRTDVTNNTLVRPGKWAVRILQETVDPSRFAACGDNRFVNNVMYLGDLDTETNIGPDTRPESFTFSHNLWFNFENPEWRGPDIPVPDPDMIVGSDPRFKDADHGDFRIDPTSPAAGKGLDVAGPDSDYYGKPYSTPRSIGAAEGDVGETGVEWESSGSPAAEFLISNFPNPFNASTVIHFTIPSRSHAVLRVYDPLGREIAAIWNEVLSAGEHSIVFDAANLTTGIYLARISAGGFRATRKLLVIR
jgi:hypothetical protein